MQLLIIDQTAVTSAGRRRWRMLAEYSGADVHLLVPDRWIENYVTYRYSPGRDENLTVHAGTVLFPGYENRGMFVNGMARAFRNARPDVVLLMEEPYSVFALQAVLARRRHAPGSRFIFYTWDNLTYGYGHVYRPPFLYRAIDRTTLANADAALAANREAIDVLRSKGFEKPVSLVYTGIDTDAFRKERGSDPFDRKEIHIGYVGRMLRAKGLDVLLRAFCRLPEDFRLSLVGSGPHSGEISAFIQASGMRRRITQVESLDPEDVPQVMRSFDLFVLPSLSTGKWKEQFGRVLVEAMAAGCAVIGSDSGAIPEVIGEAGIIVPEGNAEALAEAILRAGRDRKLRKALIEKGTLRAEKFSFEEFIKNVYKVCKP